MDVLERLGDTDLAANDLQAYKDLVKDLLTRQQRLGQERGNTFTIGQAWRQMQAALCISLDLVSLDEDEAMELERKRAWLNKVAAFMGGVVWTGKVGELAGDFALLMKNLWSRLNRFGIHIPAKWTKGQRTTLHNTVAMLAAFPAEATFAGSDAEVLQQRQQLADLRKEVRNIGLGFSEELIKLMRVAAPGKTDFQADINPALMARYAGKLCLDSIMEEGLQRPPSDDELADAMRSLMGIFYYSLTFEASARVFVAASCAG